MIRQCSLRLDLLPGEPYPAWQVFDRLTGANGGIARTVALSHPVDPGDMAASFNRDIVNMLNASDHPKCIASLRAWGSAASAAIFPEEIIRKLSAYESGDILFMVPLIWADLPFEILFLPNGFLGQRFHVGTMINTGSSQGPEKHHSLGGGLLIITDPSQRLQSADREGERLKTIAISRKRPARLVMQADRQKLIAEIQEASMVHFAGHSAPDEEYGTAGWKLGKGKYFNADDISKLGTASVLPWLVFSNSCDGGRIVLNAGLAGIAGAFLSAGVSQFIGPCCKLNDMQAAHCALSFYKYLFKGKSAAQALLLLRKERINDVGITPMFYRLFGDPRYTEHTGKRTRGKMMPLLAVIVLMLLLLIAGLNLLHYEIIKTADAIVQNIDKKLDNDKSASIKLEIGGIITFSVNLYAPTFVSNKQKAKQKTDNEKDTTLNSNDTTTAK